MHPIDFFWRAAQRWPERTAIDAPDGAISYAALAKQVAAIAAGLVAIDPGAQSRVGICASNSAGHIAALLAVLACGKVWVPLNPKSTRAEIRRLIDATQPSILVMDAACAAHDVQRGASRPDAALEIQRLVQDFAVELQKLDEGLQLLSTYLLRIRDRARGGASARLVH